VNRDRAYIEHVLAPEWKVTQTDGSIASRADVLRSAFEAKTFSVETTTIDDVGVTIVGNTAIVRGRTAATGVADGKAISARLRFTDVFVKRDGRWQAIASHASPLAT
jgi:ketosteroid isomerase-like protein